MSGHTPGSWGYGDCTDPLSSRPGDNAVYSNGTLVALVSEERGINDEQRANIRMIAAAPDMLAAMKALKEWLVEDRIFSREHDPDQCDCELCWADAAIAKAEGDDT